jgi:hypothetical protein
MLTCVQKSLRWIYSFWYVLVTEQFETDDAVQNPGEIAEYLARKFFIFLNYVVNSSDQINLALDHFGNFDVLRSYLLIVCQSISEHPQRLLQKHFVITQQKLAYYFQHNRRGIASVNKQEVYYFAWATWKLPGDPRYF